MPYYAGDAPTEVVAGAKYVIYTGAEEWDALYVDGKLRRVGDKYLINETLREILGCVEIDSDAYFLGGKGYAEEVPTRIETVEEYRTRLTNEVAQRRVMAESLRAQAAQLEAEAAAIEAGGPRD